MIGPRRMRQRLLEKVRFSKPIDEDLLAFGQYARIGRGGSLGAWSHQEGAQGVAM